MNMLWKVSGMIMRGPQPEPARSWARGRAEAEGESQGSCKCQHNGSCPFSSRSRCRDIARGRQYGLGHIHPGADHLSAAGRSVHLSHKVGHAAGLGGWWQSPMGTWSGLAQHRCALAGHIPWAWFWGASIKVCSGVPGGQGEPGWGDTGGQGWPCFALGSCRTAQ